MTKLIYVTNAKIPTAKANGLQIMKACEAFVLAGADPELVIPFRNNPIKEDPFSYYGIKTIFPIKMIRSFGPFGLGRIPNRLVFYVHALFFALGAVIYLFSKGRKNKIFYSRDYATLFFLCAFGFNPVAEIHDYRSPKPRRMISFILRRARKIVVNSEGTLALLKSHYSFPEEKWLVAPNGVDLDFFDVRETGAEARRLLDIPEDKFIFSYVGRLETAGTEKGVPDLLKAFAIFSKDRNDCLLYIVGGPPPTVEKYKESLALWDINPDLVRFAGYVRYKKIPLYLKAMDVVVVPSPKTKHSFTTSPIKIFEFMAAGKIIVASDLPALRTCLNETNAVFFEPENLEDLACKLEKVVSKQEWAEELSRQALADSRKYSWLKRAQKILAFISMTVCYFGDFNPLYSRNRVLIKGLRENGIKVLICQQDFKSRGKYLKLAGKLKTLESKFDFLIVGYSDNRFMVPLAKLLTRKPVVWDAFYSLYDSWVFDRKLVSPKSLKAKYYWFLDWLNCKLADKILLDTSANIGYFVDDFGINKRKFVRVFVGTDDQLFKPTDKTRRRNNFIVHFHGRFIPRQGAEYILEAANLLKKENVLFRIIGQGQDYAKVITRARMLELSNLEWIDRVDYEKLPEFINKSDICLGGFGNTRKARITSMNKLFEYMACGKAIITGDGASSREVLEDGKTAIFCRCADAEDLAQKILKLKYNPDLIKTLGKNARKHFEEAFTPKIIARKLIQDLK